MIAALYVAPGGVYYGRPDVDPWGLPERDARLYAGPWPVVAHPPCARWSMLAAVNEAKYGTKRGDDGGCFAAALEAARKFGGVIEHPRESSAFAAHGLPRPVRGRWLRSLFCGAWVTEVDQSNYGHECQKTTWLAVYGREPMALDWRVNRTDILLAPSKGQGAAERAAAGVRLMAKSRRHLTPPAFADLLISIAERCAAAREM